MGNKVLVVAEKPLAGYDLAKILECNMKEKGYIEGENYVVTWAAGHLITQKLPHEHNMKYKKWNLTDLPIVFPIEESLKVIEESKEQYEIIKQLIHRNDICSIINAGDAGREGYLIQSWIYRLAGNNKPVKVLWTSSFAKEALYQAFQNLHGEEEFTLLLEEAEARAEADYLIGINYSRLLTLTKGRNTVLSYGRCQTPLLNLIVLRDEEIEKFKSVPYYNLLVRYENGLCGTMLLEKKKTANFKREEDALKIKDQIDLESQGNVVSYISEEKEAAAPLLLNLPELQKQMGNKYGYTPDETLDIAQRLYEHYKILSYPRTDSRYLTSDLYDKIIEHILCCKFGEFERYIEKLDIDNLEPDMLYFNDQKVTDHHALIPNNSPQIEEIYKILTKKEKNVFDAVIASLIAIFYQKEKYRIIETIVEMNEMFFITKERLELDPGYKIIFNPELNNRMKENNQIVMQEGEKITIKEVFVDRKKTAAPSRYTISSLIAAMEKFHIGTPATMAEIIKKLQNPKGPYISLVEGKYLSTKLGRDYINYIPENLKIPTLTIEFEKELEAIRIGEKSKKEFIGGVVKDITKNVKIFSAECKANKIEYEDGAIGKCPVCHSGNIILKGNLYGCSNYSSENSCTFSVSKIICKKEISEERIKELIERGETRIMKGFISSKGNKFEAKLILNRKEKKAEFQFLKKNNVHS